MLSPLLFNVFFDAILLVVIERFSEDADIHPDLGYLQEQPSKVGPERYWNAGSVLFGSAKS